MAEGEQRRGLADAPRAEARAGAVLRAAIERRAHHRDVGVDGVPVGTGGALAKVQCPTKGRFSRPPL